MNQSIKGITGGTMGTMEFFSADDIPALFDRTGMSNVELSEYMGVSTNTIVSWRKGKRKNSVKQAHRSLLVALRKKVEAQA